MWNIGLFRPRRFWTKKIRPGEVNRTNKAVNSITGERRMIAVRETTMSIARLIVSPENP